MKLFVSPHNDDAVLFGAFTLQREHPTVLTVFKSRVQVDRGHPECNDAIRWREDFDAVRSLGCQLRGCSIADNLTDIDVQLPLWQALGKWSGAEEVWLPAGEEGGHAQHNLVALIGGSVFENAKIHRYLTYTAAGKSTHGVPVPCNGVMIRRKLIALAYYQTQIEIDALGCWPHFLRDQTEYCLPE